MDRCDRTLLVVNGNTMAALTARLGERARGCFPQDRIIEATAAFGAAYIASRVEAAVAAHAVLAAIADEVARVESGSFDACVIACFGEPGIAAAREMFPFPVVGMAEASVLSALQLAGRFAIVTVGERWPGMLDEYLRQLALRERCCGILLVQGHALDLSRDRARAIACVGEALDRAVDEYGAEAVIIGGAALTGLAAELQRDCSVPLIDSLDAALAQAEALMRLRPAGMRSKTSDLLAPARSVHGVATQLLERAKAAEGPSIQRRNEQ